MDRTRPPSRDTLTWKRFFEVVAFVVVFAVPVILYLMEKAGVSMPVIFAIGWVSIAVAAVYLVLNIPWVWADTRLGVRIRRISLVCAIALLASSYGAVNIWPNGGTHKEQESGKQERPQPLITLTLHDLFKSDFASGSTTSKRYGHTTFKNGDTGKTTDIEYAVVWQLEPGTKILLFYIPYTTETARICLSLADKYKFPLSDWFESRTEAQNNPGDSRQVTSKDLRLSDRVFVYHETYLPPEDIVAASSAWKVQHVTVIFRGPDYLQNKKTEAALKQLEASK